MGGEERARAAERAGAIWANAIQGAGQAVAGGFQAYGEQKAEEKRRTEMAKRDAAAVDFVSQWQGDDPKELMVGLMRIGGPDYAQKFGPVAQALKSKPTEDPKSELQGMYVLAQTLQDPNVPDAMKATIWEGAKTRVGPVAVKRGLLPAQVFEGEWTPEHAKVIGAVGSSLGEVLGVKPTPEAKAPGTHVVGGALVDDTGKVIYQGAEKSDTPKTHVVKGALVDDTGKVIYRAPDDPPPTPEELTLNPEGVVLTGYGTKLKEEARRQAKERGIPVFENTTTQVKGVTLKSIVQDAKELDDLLKDEAVAAVIGPALGDPINAARRGIGGVIGRNPKAQRALQLAGMLSDSELRKRTGASAGDKEMTRILGFAVDPSMPLVNLRTNLQGMLKAGARDFKALSGVDISHQAADGPVQVTTVEEYNALPSGTVYIDPNGKRRVKGNAGK